MSEQIRANENKFRAMRFPKKWFRTILCASRDRWHGGAEKFVFKKKLGRQLAWELTRRLPSRCNLNVLSLKIVRNQKLHVNKPSRIFRRVFAHFSRFSQVFPSFRTCSNLFGRVRMHSDVFGCVRTLSENFQCFGIFFRNMIFAISTRFRNS